MTLSGACRLGHTKSYQILLTSSRSNSNAKMTSPWEWPRSLPATFNTKRKQQSINYYSIQCNKHKGTLTLAESEESKEWTEDDTLIIWWNRPSKGNGPSNNIIEYHLLLNREVVAATQQQHEHDAILEANQNPHHDIRDGARIERWNVIGEFYYSSWVCLQIIALSIIKHVGDGAIELSDGLAICVYVLGWWSSSLSWLSIYISSRARSLNYYVGFVAFTIISSSAAPEHHQRHQFLLLLHHLKIIFIILIVFSTLSKHQLGQWQLRIRSSQLWLIADSRFT